MSHHRFASLVPSIRLRRVAAGLVLIGLLVPGQAFAREHSRSPWAHLWELVTGRSTTGTQIEIDPDPSIAGRSGTGPQIEVDPDPFATRSERNTEIEVDPDPKAL